MFQNNSVVKKINSYFVGSARKWSGKTALQEITNSQQALCFNFQKLEKYRWFYSTYHKKTAVAESMWNILILSLAIWFWDNLENAINEDDNTKDSYFRRC